MTQIHSMETLSCWNHRNSLSAMTEATCKKEIYAKNRFSLAYMHVIQGVVDKLPCKYFNTFFV